MDKWSFQSNNTQQHCIFLEGPNSETLSAPLFHCNKPIFLRSAHCSPPQSQELIDNGGYPNYNEFMKHEVFPTASHFLKSWGCMSLKLTRFTSPCGPTIGDVGYAIRGEFDIVERMKIEFAKAVSSSNRVKQGYDDIHFLVPKPPPSARSWPQVTGPTNIFRQRRNSMAQTFYITGSQYTHNERQRKHETGICSYENNPVVTSLAAISILSFDYKIQNLQRKPYRRNIRWHRRWCLDSMAGSGNYGLMCLLMGYNVIFSEIESKYLHGIAPVAQTIMAMSREDRHKIYLKIKKAVMQTSNNFNSKKRQAIEIAVRIHNLIDKEDFSIINV